MVIGMTTAGIVMTIVLMKNVENPVELPKSTSSQLSRVNSGLVNQVHHPLFWMDVWGRMEVTSRPNVGMVQFDEPFNEANHDVFLLKSYSLCGDPNRPYPAGDISHDCRVDFVDLAILAAHWMECTAP